ncbi:hypothetical protein ACFQMA_17410 [Halosimplex aquaticum]|uniref:Uncharacterized protein n=1 Tax=Halosimplex aquaticum TaxID=3026162 RepID=A0ABD5Y7A4_9EURY|nr:hypothetical protein [Halosimplex aquaticum]
MVEGNIHGAFVYPDGSAEAVKQRLFGEFDPSTNGLERIDDRRIQLADDERIQFHVEAPEYEPDAPEGATITPPLSCLVVNRYEGGVAYARGEGRDEYVDLFVTVYEHLPERPAAGYLMGGDQSSGIRNGTAGYRHPVTAESLGSDEFNDAAWVMVFTPPMVEQYGRDRLLGLSVRRVEELGDGSIAVVAPGDPTQYTEWRDLAAQLDVPAAADRPY